MQVTIATVVYTMVAPKNKEEFMGYMSHIYDECQRLDADLDVTYEAFADSGDVSYSILEDMRDETIYDT